MIDVMLDMSAPTVALSGLYGALAFLLLSLQLRSAWPWPVKSAAIGLSLPATVGAFWAIEAQLGWPSSTALPAQFQLHAALVEEPAPGDGDDGAIFLWLSPFDETAIEAPPAVDEFDVDAAALPGRRPRAFDLPYSRELHQEVETMRERLARGELVTGRHEVGNSRDRRFGRQYGGIDLEAPPPPPLPKKDG